ncbi:hypothetical protein [Cellvibrio japonicus]|nr:hypothetical protein [Cellvibrio japonicus]QEI13745.1 hypothetical protein FY117_17020 [Cellvibrio japonicus]QEI17319.1 hypothetical protein FY116_17025 [Cellvibrio japonicus]QEI20896.1 hypothetical protein FY115_17020 [Cellvibrio japonicus]
MKPFNVIGLCASVVLAVLLLCPQVMAQAKKDTDSRHIYRYKNEQGIVVMDSKLPPPELAAKGYEVMSRSGKVIKVVPPVLQGEAAEKAGRERKAKDEQAKADLQLRRSYSNVADIDAAKERNLQSLRGNIGILEANLSGVRTRLAQSQQQAAAIERGGREIPADLLKTIQNTEQEERDIQAQIKQREQEFNQVSAKFDTDRTRFIEITEDEKSRH